jgi:hypothetical protein
MNYPSMYTERVFNFVYKVNNKGLTIFWVLYFQLRKERQDKTIKLKEMGKKKKKKKNTHRKNLTAFLQSPSQ